MNDAQRQLLRAPLGWQGGWLATDRGLRERLRDASDQEAWQRFSHNYGPLIHRAAMRAGLAEWDAQDVTQATLVSVWRRMADFRYEPERCSFKGWLMHLARGHIADQRRKSRTRERWFEPLETVESEATEAVRDEAAEAGGVHAPGTEQLRGGAEPVEIVRVLAEAESDADFFVADSRRVRRQQGIEYPAVVTGAAFHGDLEQPVGHAFTGSADLRQATQQAGDVRNFAQPAGQSRSE